MGEASLDRLRQWEAQVAIVLGSGLDVVVSSGQPQESLAYAEFAELPQPAVAGHTGCFIRGKMGSAPVIFAQGRVHLYEGHTARQVTGGIRILAAAGVKRVILTNAAGLANENFSPGRWMMIGDQINLTGTTPLLGSVHFLDLTETYSSEWRAKFREAARAENITLHEGVYAGLLGPQYETPAEVRMLRLLGADAIGMSTVLEAIQARALGLEVAGFSCLTNWAAGIGDAPLDHEAVLETGKAAADGLARLLKATLGRS